MMVIGGWVSGRLAAEVKAAPDGGGGGDSHVWT